MDDLARIRTTLSLVLLLMSFTTIYFAKDVILPIVLGVLLSLTLSPLVRAAERVGVPPLVSAIVLITTLALAVIFGSLLMGGIVANWVDDAPSLSWQLRSKLSGVFESVKWAHQTSEQVENLTSADPVGTQKVVIKGPGMLSAAIGGLTSFGTSLALGLVLALLLLASGDLFAAKLVEAAPRLTDKKRVLRIVKDVERSISQYLLSITVINAGLGLTVGATLYLLDVPHYYVFGAMAFLFNFLPYIGALAGVALVAAYSIITFDSLSYAVVIPIVYFMLTSIEGQLVTPYLLGRQMELNPVSVFLTLILWAWLWGVPGALMAVPILVVLKVVFSNVESLNKIGNFLSARYDNSDSSKQAIVK